MGLPSPRDEADVADDRSDEPSVRHPRKPGWFPDPSAPAVVRWWDGFQWANHTAPNDAQAPSRGAPRHVGRIVVSTILIVLAVLGLAGAAYTFFLLFMVSQWSSNK
jgi:hypothetical protein